MTHHYDLMAMIRNQNNFHITAAEENVKAINRIMRPRRMHIEVIDQSRPEVLSKKSRFANSTELFIDFDPHKTYHDEEELV